MLQRPLANRPRMISRFQWLVMQFSRKLWLRVTVIALLGVATAVAGIVFAPYVPDALSLHIGASAIDDILNIMASSMLAVTVFSVSTMVAAYSDATNNLTARATRLLMQDNTSQNVLGTFIGSFLFSLFGIIALSTGLYGPAGRVIMLFVTIALIVLIAATIVRWIDYLSRFGRLNETIARVEAATWTAMETRLRTPHLGGQPLSKRLGGIPDTALPVFAKVVGYIQHVDTSALQDSATTHGAEIFLNALPGTFVDPSRALAFVTGTGAETVSADLISAFSINDERTFDQDPRFGLCVLAEIASRALSPGINDPGTAIDVIGRSVRLFVKWAQFQETQDKSAMNCPLVWVPAISDDDMFDDVFAPIARDGAAMIEVQLRLQKAFKTLVATDRRRYAAAAQKHSALALRHAIAAMALPSDIETLRNASIAQE